MIQNKKKSGSIFGKIIITFILGGLAAGTWYVYTAPEFEREKPQIISPSEMYWNRTSPLQVQVKDNVALKSYEVSMSDGNKTVMIDQGVFDGAKKEGNLTIKFPKKMLDPKAKEITVNVKVNDKSMWNMLAGNSAEKSMHIYIDYKRPNVNIVSNSRMINQGGAALVIFQADDENLDKLYIKANKNIFKAQPYKKEGYYAALIAWSFKDDNFDAKIVATDLAKNKREVHIPFYHKNPRYKTSFMEAKDKFIDGKITDLASSDPEFASITDKLKKFRAINETMRLNNEKLIHSLSKNVSDDMLESWKIKRFHPLKNGQKLGGFGDHRKYYYKDKNKVVSESYHVGLDMASNSMANIVSTNPGKVVFAEDNGIYGNMPLIDHGLGLYTLYGHCSQLLVNEGDEVSAGQVIAKTGKTGLALGDHLHFGMLVQGVEVRPVEWFDSSWIKKFIDNVFKQADSIIAPPPEKEEKSKV